jgi:hypothetical protein
MTLPRGGPTDGELEVESAVKPDGSKTEVKELIDRLLMENTNTHDAAVAELKRYAEVDQASWPLPKGYRTRLSPSYMAHVYQSGRRAEEHGRIFLRAHGLEDCALAQELISGLCTLDRLLLIDRKVGFINDVNTEYICRRCYGLERGFENCRVKSDWLKPRNNPPKDWVSKVDWDMVDRYDPSSQKSSLLQSRAAEDEVRAEIDRDAQLLKARNKLNTNRGERKNDPLNP